MNETARENAHFRTIDTSPMAKLKNAQNDNQIRINIDAEERENRPLHRRTFIVLRLSEK